MADASWSAEYSDLVTKSVLLNAYSVKDVFQEAVDDTQEGEVGVLSMFCIETRTFSSSRRHEGVFDHLSELDTLSEDLYLVLLTCSMFRIKTLHGSIDLTCLKEVCCDDKVKA